MSTKTIAWNTGSGDITLTYQGQGDGTISVVSDANNGDARSQTITIQTTKGGLITKNVTVSQAACPIPVGDVINFAYTGNVQSVILPAGKYNLQCWGAQGGMCTDGYSGGKGGYSEGLLTLTAPTTVYIFVGGKGSSSGNGGWNGGGGGSGSSAYSSGDEYGGSSFGCGGGATDIALVSSSMSYSSYRNNRSSASLLSRMIVAGGGSGGAYGYQEVTTTVTSWENVTYYENMSQMPHPNSTSSVWSIPTSYFEGEKTYRLHGPSEIYVYNLEYYNGSTKVATLKFGLTNYDTFTVNSTYLSQSTRIAVAIGTTVDAATVTGNVYLEIQQTSSQTTTDNDSQVGFVGGGTTGGGYSSSYQGKQNGAGSNGSFGFGANQTVTDYRYGAGCGGGGWYGGGNSYSNSELYTVRCSGGGSGFVNTSASAGNRPSGYTGLQLDSGTTYDGEQSFPAVDGGNETGHSGNGYARITRLYTDVTDFEYTGAVQSKTLRAGTYMIECWGAQGGSYNDTYHGGKGGYSVGKLTLKESTTIYVYVGGQGTGGTTKGEKAGGFNGGGLGYSTSTTYIECGGGGASDVRIGQDSLYARVIVAGGGGGAGSYSASYRYAGGAGGGVSGATPSRYSTSYRAGTGGTQTARGKSYYGSTANSTTYGTLADFGVGAGANSGTTSYQITGGGAGWYGGGYSRRGAGGGGSGYVYNASTASHYPSGCLLNSEHYLADAETKAGNTSIPSTSYGTETGHEGNGYVRITRLS